MSNKTRVGVSIILVNTNNGIDVEINDKINSIFNNYREYLVKPFISDKSHYYKPLSCNLFGHFDKAYIYLNDDFHLSNKYLHPSSTILSSDKKVSTFNFKLITGDYLETESEKSPSEKLYYKFENYLESKVFCLTRIKLNSKLLFTEGGKVVTTAKTEVSATLGEKSKSIVIESFGFHELVLFSFWDNIDDASISLQKIRDLTYKGKRLFVSSSTMVGVNKNLNFNEYKWNWKLTTILSVRPGYLNKVVSIIDDSIKNKNFKYQSLFGWQDLIVEDLYKELGSQKEINCLIKKLNKYVESIQTAVSVRNISFEDDINEFDEIDFEIENYLIKQSEINEINSKLLHIGINQVVIHRIINSISNFNKCISEPDNFPYFLLLRKYLIKQIIENIKNIYNSVYQGILIGYVSIIDVEAELVQIIKGFETAFTNRYIHSKELAEFSDINASYKGGIQQYLIVYEYLYNSMYSIVYQEADPDVTLVVSGNSQTVSWPFYMKMNIFQVYDPGLFLVVLAHEVSIHIYEKLLMECFIEAFDDGSSIFFSLFDKKIKRILNGHAKLGYTKSENPYFIKLYDMFPVAYTENVNEAVQFRNEETYKYFLTDLITLNVTFNRDIDLFLYWHVIYFCQLYGLSESNPGIEGDKSYSGHLKSILVRFLLLLNYLNENRSLKEIIESIMDFKYFEEEYLIALVDSQDIIAESETNKYIIYLFEQIIKDENIQIIDFEKTFNITHIDYTTPYAIHKEEIENRGYIPYQRFCGYSYLKCFQNEFPNIKTSQNINFKSKNINKEENVVFINNNGNISLSGDNQRELAYNFKINYVQNMWHLSNLEKSKYV